MKPFIIMICVDPYCEWLYENHSQHLGKKWCSNTTSYGKNCHYQVKKINFVSLDLTQLYNSQLYNSQKTLSQCRYRLGEQIRWSDYGLSNTVLGNTTREGDIWGTMGGDWLGSVTGKLVESATAVGKLALLLWEDGTTSKGRTMEMTLFTGWHQAQWWHLPK